MGLTPDERVMTLDHFLKAVHSEDSERVRAEFERCLKEDGGFNVEFRVRWSDGSLHWLRDQGKVFYDEAGSPLFMTGACVDITVRKHGRGIGASPEVRRKCAGSVYPCEIYQSIISCESYSRSYDSWDIWCDRF
jgi:hypothetical protein